MQPRPSLLWSPQSKTLVQFSVLSILKLRSSPPLKRTCLTIIVLYIHIVQPHIVLYCVYLLYILYYDYVLLYFSRFSHQLATFSLNFSFSLSLSNDKLDIFVLLFVYFILLGLSHQFFYVLYNFILFDIVLYFIFVSRLSLISTCRLPIAHISVCDTNKKSTYKKK